MEDNKKQTSNGVKKNIFIAILLLIGIIASIFVSANFNQNIKTHTDKASVITTIFPLYDFAKNIGQDKTEVTLLLPPGVEAHTFEPKPSDIIKINEADLFIYTGKFMEPWAEDVIKGISNKNIKIVDSSVGIEMMKGEEKIDPHIWLDFDNDKIIIDNIVKALTEKDSANADFYQKNANDYKIKLAQLDNQYKTALAGCQNKKIVYGGHYAFGYMGKRYGLAYEAAYGISPNSEPSALDLVKLVEQIKKDNIKYVFYEELVSPKVAETLAKETGAKLLLLVPAGNLTKKDYENQTTFLSIMEGNLKNLSIGLKCNN